ncbi:MAG: hypothetical protein M1826_005752 [Phylliscum demangeonii]|nr:MAG: hypothetical protein M1826_005752 [Phylliscum demangeonii]
MQLSCRHLALLGAFAAAAVAVLPLQFTYQAIVNRLQEVVAKERVSYFGEKETWPLIPASKCPEHCTKDLPKVLRQELDGWKGRVGMTEAARALHFADHAQAMLELKRAMDDVGGELHEKKCKNHDASPPPRKPISPGDNALDAAMYAEPQRPEPPGPWSGPPSARDDWASDEPFHSSFKPDPICVKLRRARGMSQAVAEHRCRFQPFHKTQPAPSPGLLVPGSAPVGEPAAPLMAPNVLMLKGGL